MSHFGVQSAHTRSGAAGPPDLGTLALWVSYLPSNLNIYFLKNECSPELLIK